MTRKEAMRQTMQADTLRSLGFTQNEAEALRHISMTLHRWFELECGDSNNYASWAIERDEETEIPYMMRHIYAHGAGKDQMIKTRIADRETGARTRLKAIIDARNTRISAEQIVCPNCGQWQLIDCLNQCIHKGFAPCRKVWSYIQTDPRGASLYILRPGDVPVGGTAESYYNRGVCIW